MKHFRIMLRLAARSLRCGAGRKKPTKRPPVWQENIGFFRNDSAGTDLAASRRPSAYREFGLGRLPTLGKEVRHAKRFRSASSASSPDASDTQIWPRREDFFDALGDGPGRPL